MNLNFLSENNARLFAFGAIGLFAILMLVWMLQQIRSTAAYRKAMLAIAESAAKGEKLTLQVANFPQNGTVAETN